MILRNLIPKAKTKKHKLQINPRFYFLLVVLTISLLLFFNSANKNISTDALIIASFAITILLLIVSIFIFGDLNSTKPSVFKIKPQNFTFNL